MATTVTIHNQTNKSSAIVVVGDAGDQTINTGGTVILAVSKEF